MQSNISVVAKIIKDTFLHVSIISFRIHYYKSWLTVVPNAVSYWTSGRTYSTVRYEFYMESGWASRVILNIPGV